MNTRPSPGSGRPAMKDVVFGICRHVNNWQARVFFPDEGRRRMAGADNTRRSSGRGVRPSGFDIIMLVTTRSTSVRGDSTSRSGLSLALPRAITSRSLAQGVAAAAEELQVRVPADGGAAASLVPEHRVIVRDQQSIMSQPRPRAAAGLPPRRSFPGSVYCGWSARHRRRSPVRGHRPAPGIAGRLSPPH